jgi:chemotaxis response regulator CheB
VGCHLPVMDGLSTRRPSGGTHPAPTVLSSALSLEGAAGPCGARKSGAVEGTILANGTCYLAAANEHVSVGFSGSRPCITRHSNNRNGGSEAIDQLMISAAEHLKDKASGIILTGAGSDGIKGLGEIIRAGGAAFVQDPRSCLFKETPTLAIELYTVDNTVSDKQMAGAINAFIESITR